jgi:hypothetical protein
MHQPPLLKLLLHRVTLPAQVLQLYCCGCFLACLLPLGCRNLLLWVQLAALQQLPQLSNLLLHLMKLHQSFRAHTLWWEGPD